MITETHIRSLQNPTKFVKIANDPRNPTITHKCRLLTKAFHNKTNANSHVTNQPDNHTAVGLSSLEFATQEESKWTIVS